MKCTVAAMWRIDGRGHKSRSTGIPLNQATER